MPYAPRAPQVMPLICPHGHGWQTRVLSINWEGPLYENKFCPDCGRPGDRLQFTAADLGNMISDDDIREVGRDAMPALSALLLVIAQEQQKSNRWETSFLLPELAEFIAEHPQRVEGYLKRLEHLGFLKVEKSETIVGRLKASLGTRVHLVQLAL